MGGGPTPKIFVPVFDATVFTGDTLLRAGQPNAVIYDTELEAGGYETSGSSSRDLPQEIRARSRALKTDLEKSLQFLGILSIRICAGSRISLNSASDIPCSTVNLSMTVPSIP